MMQDANRQSASPNTAERLASRHAVPRAERAYVQFDYPLSSGKRRRLSLLDMSTNGLCFTVPFFAFSGLSLATHLSDVIVRVGGREIAGDLLVSHVTRESEERILCGGRFSPTSETDRLQMIEALANLKQTHKS